METEIGAEHHPSALAELGELQESQEAEGSIRLSMLNLEAHPRAPAQVPCTISHILAPVLLTVGLYSLIHWLFKKIELKFMYCK